MRSVYPITINEFRIATDQEHEGQLWLNWSWDDPYWTPNLDHWEVWPSYSYVNSNNALAWVDLGSESVPQNAQARWWEFYWDIPTNVESVHFRLRPISKNRTDGTGVYFEEDFYQTEDKYFGGSIKPDTPSTPSVTQDQYLGTTVVLGLDNIELDGNNIYVTQAEFQVIIYKTDSLLESGTVGRTVTALIDEFGNVRTSLAIGSEYGFKFRVRLCAVKTKHGDGADDPIVVKSDWSEMSDMLYGVCKKPKLKVNKFNSTQVEYTITTDSHAYAYQLEMAPDQSCFVKMDDWERENPQYKTDSEQRKIAADRFGIVSEWMHEPDTQAGTEATKNWVEDALAVARDLAYYRARSLSARENGFYSQWSDVTDESTLSFSDGLRAPIIWSATEFAEVGDPSIQLSVMHNSPNGSPSCLCKIQYGINDVPSPLNIINVEPPSGQQNGNVVYSVNFDLSAITEETVIQWRAVTYEGSAVIEANMSPFSEIKTFAVHEKPGIEVRIDNIDPNNENNGLPVVTTYPIKFITETTYSSSYLNEIKVTSMGFKIISRQSYRRLDRYGNPTVIKAGDVLYSSLDVTDPRDKTRYINANEITLDDNITYTLEATVCLNNGANAVDTFDFTVDMAAKEYIIECTGTINPNNVSLDLRPAAIEYKGTGLEPSGDPVPFGYDSYIWVANGKLYCSYNKVYDPETGVISDTGWDLYVEGYPLVSDQFWQAEDGRMLGYAGNFGTIFNEETGEWERDTREVRYATSEPIFRTKMPIMFGSGTYEWSDFLFRTYQEIGSSDVIVDMSVFNDGDWQSIPEGSIRSEAVGGIIAQSAWYFYNGEYITGMLSTGQYDYDFGIYSTISPPVQIYNVTGFVNRHLPGLYVWHAGNRTFWSNGSTHYELIFDESLEVPLNWTPTTFEGLSSFYGTYVKTIDGVAYTTYNSYLYKLDLDTMTWEMVNANAPSGPVRTYANGVNLSVYRKNDDGTMVPIAENVVNESGINITDPHPNLGGSNYRIVATDMESGEMTFYDPPPYDMKCTDIILQWDEYYASRPNTGSENELPEMGNMIRLPYNIDVSESANMESEMVSYIGRSNPVSYYGTQTGYTASWSTEIPKYDKETIKMLRKLQVFAGDVYVREPNGTGYWANVKVTFPINHLALTVSVSISITRVEGGA